VRCRREPAVRVLIETETSRIGGSGPINDLRTVKLYHLTMHSTEILRDGFGETTGTYLTESDHSGVWLFDQPVEKRIGGGDEAVMLELEIPEPVVLPFESVGNLPYRQFLMPAALVNLYGSPRVSNEN
jgi:hypothetical protein